MIQNKQKEYDNVINQFKGFKSDNIEVQNDSDENIEDVIFRLDDTKK